MQDQLDNILIRWVWYSYSLFTLVFFLDLLSSAPLSGTIEPKSITNARRLYASCINEDIIEMKSVDTILSFIKKELGGWPILQGPIWNDSTFNYSSLLVKLHEYNKNVIYNINTKIDLINSSVYCIRVRQIVIDLQGTTLTDSSLLSSSFVHK
jgi:hypothetical protein